MEAAQKAFGRNKGKDWSSASGAVRAKYLRAIASKVYFDFSHLLILSHIQSDLATLLSWNHQS